MASPRRVRVPRGSGGPVAGAFGIWRSWESSGILIVLLIVGLLSGGGGGGSTSSTSARTNTSAKHRSARPGATRGRQRRSARQDDRDGVRLSLRATGRCMCACSEKAAGSSSRGKTLEAGARTPTFHSRHFVLTLGNNAVTLLIDGTPRVVPASASAIGYSITKAGRTVLAPGHMPTCA